MKHIIIEKNMARSFREFEILIKIVSPKAQQSSATFTYLLDFAA